MIHLAQHPLQALDDIAAETGNQRLARTVGQIGDGDKAGTLQGEDRLLLKPQGADGQRAHGMGLGAGRTDAPLGKAGKGPGGIGGAGNGRAQGEAHGSDAAGHVIAQNLLAAEEMGAAGNVEHETVRPIEADQGGVAITPVSQMIKQHAISRRIVVHGDQGRHADAGIGQGQTRHQAVVQAPLIDMGEAEGIVDPAQDDERQISWPGAKGRPSPALPMQPVGRQEGQPQGEIATVPGKHGGHDPIPHASAGAETPPDAGTIQR